MSDYARFRRADSATDPVLVVSGEVDMVTARKFRAHLHDIIGVATAQAYLDLSAVSFFESTGINILVHAQDAAEAQTVDLVVDPSACVRAIVDLVGLGERFHWGPPPASATGTARKSA